MAKPVRDVFAWLRLFMSAQGPPPTTRLVLVAHSLFMNRDGTRCIVGVRHLATICELDKTTVAHHRSLALQLGWLIGSKRPRGRGNGELYPAAPDALNIATSERVSVHSRHLTFTQSEVSGMIAPTVRLDHSNCTANPDVPSPPLLPLGKRLAMRQQESIAEKRDNGGDAKDLEKYLLNMLNTDPRVPHYLHDLRSLANLVPPCHRPPGYEQIIQRLIRNATTGK